MINLTIRTLLGSALLMSSIFAWAETVVIVNPANTNTFSTEEISRIFMGKVRSFPNGDACTPVDLPKGDVRDAFYLKMTGKTRNQMASYWSQQVFSGSARMPKEATSETDAVSLVAKSRGAIAYVDQTKVNSSVKVVYFGP